MRLPTLRVTADTREAERMLQDRADRLRDMRTVLEHVARILREDAGSQFAQGGDPAWQPLQPSTVMAKRMADLPPRGKGGRILPRLKQRGVFGPASILIATGALRDSYRRKGARGHVERIDTQKGTVHVGSQLRTPDGRHSLAAIHQYGTAPYLIVAKNRKALAFVGSTGETVLRRAVKHPGVPARPVVISAEARDRIAESVRAWVRGDTAQGSAA